MNARMFASLIILLLIASLAVANVRLPAIISDNMVIQAGADVPIWGWAQPGEAVAVTIGGQNQKTTTGADGKWMIHLSPFKAADKPLEMTVAGKNTITVKNILVGQVWLGAGQSNMNMPVGGFIEIRKDMPNPGIYNAVEEAKNARYPNIRYFDIPLMVGARPQTDCNGQWVECSPKTVGEFSATLYFFGRDIFQQLNEPVGLIHSSVGASHVDEWTSEEALRSEPASEAVFAQWKKNLENYPANLEKYKIQLEQWKRDVSEAKAAGKPAPKAPKEPIGPKNPHQPTVLYNGMIAPVIPYAIKGVVWYQGESDADHAWRYRKLFPLMIADWRNRWHEGDFPVYFVQIANFNKWARQTWPELRQAQLETLAKVANTGMAVAIDIGDANDVHPKNKQEVGRRLSLWAMAKTYGKNIEYSGPLYKDMKIEGGKIIVNLTHADGLVAKQGTLKEFMIAGADKKFVPAKAIIEKQTVVVSSPDVNNPVAVRYGWANDPAGVNLYNAAGLPASPFKTDDWTWETEKAK